jgi:hypothetical protein
MSSRRGDDGQATIEYVAVLALLALLLVVSAAVVSGRAPGIANAFLGQFRRALCIVSGGDCPADTEKPCVVAGSRDTHHTALSIGFVRLDEDHSLLREKLSDGTVRLTIAQNDAAGIEGGIGGILKIRLKGHTLSAEREAHGAVQGVLAHGAVYLARDDHEADDILRAVRGGLQLPGLAGEMVRIGKALAGRHGPRPQSVYFEGGVRGLGRLNATGLGASASLEGFTEAMLGASRNMDTGEVTVSLGDEASGSALLDAALAGPAGVSGGQVGLSLTFDRHHRATGLSLNASGTVAAGATLPAWAAQALGVGDGRLQSNTSTSSRRWELSESIDLRDRAVAAAWAAYRHDPLSLTAIRALGARLHDEAQVDVRSYATSGDSSGVAAGVAFAVKFGGELEHAVDRSRLLSAASRPPGGLWEQRFDCESA